MQPSVGGGLITSHVVFESSSNMLLVSSIKGVTLFNYQTGEVVSRIPVVGDVKGIFVYDSSNFFVVTVHGLFTLYSLATLLPVGQWNACVPVMYIQQIKSSTFVMETDKGTFKVTIDVHSTMPEFCEVSSGVSSCDGEYAIRFDDYTLELYNNETGEKQRCSVTSSKIFRVFQHPTKPMKVFVIEDSGRLVLYHFDRKDKDITKKRKETFRNTKDMVAGMCDGIPTMQFHWHPSGFTGFVAYQGGHKLLTGGREGVLVFWDTFTGERTYLTQLGHAIQSITLDSDEKLAALTLSNNTIVVVELSTRKIVKTICGLLREESARAYQGPAGQMVMIGDGPVIQLYDPVVDRCIAEAYVSRPNVITASIGNEKLPDAQVSQVAFVDNDNWMVSYDQRKISERYQESNLRFFRRRVNGTYEQMLVIPEPSQSAITSIRASPINKLVVTTSLDHMFKVWVLVSRETIQTKGGVRADVTWKCRSIGAYYGEPSYDSAFSNDGSVIAVSFKTAITLWDVASNKLLFSIPISVPKAVKLSFLSESRYLLSVCGDDVVVWDILSRSVYQSFISRSPLIAAHRRLDMFAYTNQSESHVDIHLMRAGSMVPIAVWRHDTPIKSMQFYSTITGVEYICVVDITSKIVMIPLESLIDKTAKGTTADSSSATVSTSALPVHQQKGIAIRNLAMDETDQEAKLTKIVAESTLDALEVNIADVNSMFSTVVECLLK